MIAFLYDTLFFFLYNIEEFNLNIISNHPISSVSFYLFIFFHEQMANNSYQFAQLTNVENFRMCVIKFT